MRSVETFGRLGCSGIIAGGSARQKELLQAVELIFQVGLGVVDSCFTDMGRHPHRVSRKLHTERYIFQFQLMKVYFPVYGSGSGGILGSSRGVVHQQLHVSVGEFHMINDRYFVGQVNAVALQEEMS